METINFMLIAIIFIGIITVITFAIYYRGKYYAIKTELSINDAHSKRIEKRLFDKEQAYEEMIDTREQIIKELKRDLKMWKSKAYAPDYSNSPIIVSESKMKLLSCSNTFRLYSNQHEIEAVKKETLKGLLESVKPFIRTIRINKGRSIEHRMSIYVATPE